VKKKVLFLIQVPPPIHGSSVIGRIIKESEKINSAFECYYINISTSDSAEKIGTINFKKLLSFVENVYLITKCLIINRIDLIYLAPTVTDLGFIRDFILVIFLKLFKINIIFHLHNKGVSKNRTCVHRWMYKLFFNNVKVIILSKLLYNDLSEYVNEANVFVCPNGIDISSSLYYDMDRKISSEKMNIIFLSNLIKSKGLFDLIEACTILKSKGIAFKAQLIGAELDVSKSMLQAFIIERGLSEEIDYLGVKVGIEKHNHLLLADVFVFPTFYEKECFPLVILEAMEYGLPVISTREGGIPDLITHGKNGFLVNKNSPEEIAFYLEKLNSNNELMKNFGEESRNIFFQNYTKSIFEKKIVSIISSVN
jgi:glycosyltransferase involved in cell wall biosynthesis